MAGKHGIPAWVLQCLDQYGNCAIGYNLTKKMGKDKMLKALADLGYPCDLEIIADQKDKSALPKEGTYIVTLKSRSEIANEEGE